jgi:hypothetical protein
LKIKKKIVKVPNQPFTVGQKGFEKSCATVPLKLQIWNGREELKFMDDGKRTNYELFLLVEENSILNQELAVF